MQTKSGSTVLIILIVLFTFPFWIGGLLGGLFGLIGGIFGAIAGIFGAVIGLIGGFFGWIFDWHWPWLFHWNAFTIILIAVVIALLSRSRRI